MSVFQVRSLHRCLPDLFRLVTSLAGSSGGSQISRSLLVREEKFAAHAFPASGSSYIERRFLVWRSFQSAAGCVNPKELQAGEFGCGIFGMGKTKKQRLRDSGGGAWEVKKGDRVWKEKCATRESSSAAEAFRGDGESSPDGAHMGVESLAPDESEDLIIKEIHVDEMLLRFLVGKDGSTKEKIEKSCKVKLKVPSVRELKTSKRGCFIAGKAGGIQEAEIQIKAVLKEAVDAKLQYTHFISLPLAFHSGFRQQVQDFQLKVLARHPPTPASLEEDEAESSDQSLDKEENSREQKRPSVSLQPRKGENSGGAGEEDVVMVEAKSSSSGVSGVDENLDTSKKIHEIGTEHVSKAEVKQMEKGVVEVKLIPHKSGIDSSIFIKPHRVHLTVLMLKLWNEERVQQAKEVLERCQGAVHEALAGKPVVVDFKGVGTMRGKPDKTHVLYACVEDSEDKSRLLQACQVLIEAYVECGLVMEKDIGQTLKLHATLMNTSHRVVKKNRKFGRRIPFDASDVLQQYGEWNWGSLEMGKLIYHKDLRTMNLDTTNVSRQFPFQFRSIRN